MEETDERHSLAMLDPFFACTRVVFQHCVHTESDTRFHGGRYRSDLRVGGRS
jgi:hypothetical protein